MATIDDIDNGDSGLTARIKINSNFAALNSDKAETTVTNNFETTAQLDGRDTANRDRANHTGDEPYDNSTSGLTADNVQAAIDELDASIDNIESEITVTTDLVTIDDDLTVEGDLSVDGTITGTAKTGLGSLVPLTISSGTVTVTGPGFYEISPETGSSDNLDTISGGSEGDIVVFKSVNSSVSITYRNAQDNLRMAGNFVADSSTDMIGFIKSGSVWASIIREGNG